MRQLSPFQIEVLAAIAAMPRPHAYALKQQIRRNTASVYAAVSALESRGLIAAQWEEEATPGRPPRKFVSLTEEGRRMLAAIPSQSSTTTKGSLQLGRT